MKRKCKVVMLPTKEKAPIQLGVNLQANIPGEFRDTYFHLYILSDDEIKEGDWFINITKNTVHKCHSVSANIQSDLNGGKYHGKFECRKIIATTNKSLNIHWNKQDHTSLSQPSQAFIEKYVSEYNKGNIITDVMVEYYFTHETTGDKSLCPKVDKNNEITITRIKDSWSREEVIEFGLKCVNLGMDLKNNPLPRLNDISGRQYYYNWIEENL